MGTEDPNFCAQSSSLHIGRDIAFTNRRNDGWLTGIGLPN